MGATTSQINHVGPPDNKWRSPDILWVPPYDYVGAPYNYVGPHIIMWGALNYENIFHMFLFNKWGPVIYVGPQFIYPPPPHK